MTLLEKLNKLRRSHRVCEDQYYSCPLSEDGPYEIIPGAVLECDCGADEHNQLLDEVIEELKERDITGRILDR